jgi:hypothetical protein
LKLLISAPFARHESAPLKRGALFFYKSNEPKTAELESKVAVAPRTKAATDFKGKSNRLGMEETMDELQQRGKILRRTEGVGTVTPQMDRGAGAGDCVQRRTCTAK